MTYYYSVCRKAAQRVGKKIIKYLMGNNYEYALELYHHQEYEKAKNLIIDIIEKKEVKYGSLEYANLLYYLGSSRVNIFLKERKNKSLLFEAKTDFATPGNSLLQNQGVISNHLNEKIKFIERIILL